MSDWFKPDIPAPPPPPPPTPMTDEEAVKNARKKEMRKPRAGRASTILSDAGREGPLA